MQAGSIKINLAAGAERERGREEQRGSERGSLLLVECIQFAPEPVSSSIEPGSIPWYRSWGAVNVVSSVAGAAAAAALDFYYNAGLTNLEPEAKRNERRRVQQHLRWPSAVAASRRSLQEIPSILIPETRTLCKCSTIVCVCGSMCVSECVAVCVWVWVLMHGCCRFCLEPTLVICRLLACTPFGYLCQPRPLVSSTPTRPSWKLQPVLLVLQLFLCSCARSVSESHIIKGPTLAAWATSFLEVVAVSRLKTWRLPAVA